MVYIEPEYLKQVYESEISKIEREFFDGMKEDKTLEELKPILLKLKQIKIYLANLTAASQHHTSGTNSLT